MTPSAQGPAGWACTGPTARGGGPWRLALATEALVPPESLGSISSDQKYLKKKKIFQKVDP